jgi:hypothetical protein
MFSFGSEVANAYRIANCYTIAVDVYSRYTVIRVNTDKDGKLPKGQGSTITNFVGVLDMFLEYPEMVVDAEYDVREVKDFCSKHNIKLYILPTGSINANNIAERTIQKVKKIFQLYIYNYNDVIEERLKEKDIDIIKNSYESINPIVYFMNRNFHTRAKVIPIEIYLGIEGANLLMTNMIQYPEFQVGQYVYASPRGRYKSLQFQAKKMTTGILGQIIARPTKSAYTIKTILSPPNDKINVKWYDFIPITEEEFNKLKKMPLFQ